MHSIPESDIGVEPQHFTDSSQAREVPCWMVLRADWDGCFESRRHLWL